VNEAVRLDFATGVRSILRQDPDIILVGEIRDEDTASMAFRAAMTGHQVFSTLHTNSSIGAIPRLIDLGIRPDIMAGNIIGVMAQRLVRKLCNECKKPYEPVEMERRLLGLTTTARLPAIYRAVGCEQCDRQGYRGRTALMELLKFDFDLDELIARQATTREITKAAFDRGFKPLAEAGICRVLDGTTSLDEISRVIDLTERVK
jgi:type II secretory ATPase GspE/PulE/Tfp pilus assembly ATPase PilB-like protein